MKKRWMAAVALLALALTLLPVGVLAVEPEEPALPEGYVFLLNPYWDEDYDLDGVYRFNILDNKGYVTQMKVPAQLRDLITAGWVDTYADGWAKNPYVGKFLKITAMTSEDVVTALEPAGELVDIAHIDYDGIVLKGGRFYQLDMNTECVYIDMVITEGEEPTPQDDTLVYGSCGNFNPTSIYDRENVADTPQIGKEPICKAIRPYDSVRALVIPDETDSGLAKYIYVQRNVWGAPGPGAPWYYTHDKTFTGGFRWRFITDPEADEYVADQFAADAKFYWNGTERTKSEFETELEPKTYCLSMSDGYIPGLVVKFYCDGNKEIGLVEVIEHSVAQLTAQVETRVSAEGILQVKVPGLVDDWTNADQVLGDQGLAEGDVLLYYTVGDGAARTYIMEKAEKITGRVATLNTKGQIGLTNDTPGIRHGRTGLQTVPASATLGFDHPAYTNGNNTFAHWPVATVGNTYDFFLDKNGDVCFIQKARFVPVTGVSLSKSDFSMEEGTIRALTATVEPADADNQTVYWTSDDTTVVTVDWLSGKLTAHKVGTATVTAFTDDRGFTATCLVTVTKAAPEPSITPSAEPSPGTTPSTQPSATPVAVTGVELNRSKVSLQENETTSLTATVKPANATDKGVYWTSSDTAVLAVSDTGKLTARREGAATVTVTTLDGNFTATCAVTVTKASSSSSGGSSSGGSSGGGGSSSGGSSGGSSSGGGGGTSSGGSSSTPAPTPAAPKPVSEKFTDVVKDSWYEPGVTYVVNKGLFKGMSEGVFAPDTNMTRAMLMTVLARLDGQDTSGGDTWYSKGMDWAVANGISDGTLPDGNVTREQLVTMLYRYAKATAEADDLTAFADGDSVSGWAVEAMAWAVRQGIVTGKDGGRLDPQGTATRAEVATIIQRFVENK